MEIEYSDEEIKLHKSHLNNECAEWCDLCWMQAPPTVEEINLLQNCNGEDFIVWED